MTRFAFDPATRRPPTRSTRADARAPSTRGPFGRRSPASQPASRDPGDLSAQVQSGRGEVIVGGSPLVMLRLTAAGVRLLDRIESGHDLAAPPPTPTPSSALLERLVDAGVVHPLPEPGTGAPLRDVAVVIPHYDRPDGLTSTLESLRQTAPELREVIVADDGSRHLDLVRRAVSAAEAVSPWPIQLVERARNGGAGAARNTGAASTTAPVIAFVDAGCQPEPGWLGQLLPHLADPRVALVAPRIVGGSRTRDASEGGRATAVARYEAARSSLDLGPDPAPVRPRSRVPYVPATTVVVRARDLAAVGGFEPALRVGEDVDLVWRLHEAGRRVRYEPSARVGHDHPTTLGAWAARRVDYGSSAALLAARHPGNLAPLGVSPWSAAIWAMAAAGHPISAAAVAGGTAAALARKLRGRGLAHPGREAVRLAGQGHLGAGRLLASAVTRAWLPAAVAGALVSRRARQVVLAAVAVPALLEWRARRPDLDPARFVALAAIDDAAYGLGVWKGVLQHHAFEPVVPTFTSWKT